MELQLQYPLSVSVSLIFSFLLFLFLLTKISIKTKPSSKLPPGPWQLPLIGNMHQLLGSLTHHILRDLSNKHGPLMFLRLGLVPTIVISSPKIAQEVLKTHGINFADRPYVMALNIFSYNSLDIGFSEYGDYWRQLRKICTIELFSAKRVQTFRSIRESEVLNLVKAIHSNAGSTVNLSKLIFDLTYTITARSALGGKVKDQELFIKLMEEAVKETAGFSVVDLYPSVKLLQLLSRSRIRLEKLQRKWDKILEDVVFEHRKTGEGEMHEDLVDVLLRIQKQGDTEIPLTDEGIKAVIFDIFTAGSETSSTIVEWAISEMIRNPRVMERAQAEVRKVFDEKRNVDETGLDELKYLQSVIKETLRLHPAAPLLVPRQNREECEINGYVIPAKSRVIVNAWAISRNPKYWGAEAEIFKPERFLDSSIDYKGTNFEYIPFGAGRRICPGMFLAIANIELPLAQLLYHFDWKLGSKQEDLDMTEEFAITVRRKNDLNLIPVPYRRSLLQECP